MAFCVYLAGIIDGKHIDKCKEWRTKIIEHYTNWKGTGKNYGNAEFLNPINGEDQISEDGLTSHVPSKSILAKDYNAIKKCDLFIVNMNTFGVVRPPIGCYSDDTEILTEKGWMLFKDFIKTRNLKVFTLSKDNKIELQKPTKYYKFKNSYDYIYHFKSRKYDLMITPNHNFVIDDEITKQRKLIRADSIPSRIFVPKCGGDWIGKEKSFFILPGYKINNKRKVKDLSIKMDNWLYFLGWFISEGCVIVNKRKNKYNEYSVAISQTKKENLNKIKKAIEDINMQSWYDGKNFIINNKQLALYLLRIFGKYAENKYIPYVYKQLSKRQLNILWSSLLNGDGSVDKNNFSLYYTISKKLINDIQEILLKMGYSCNIRQRKRKPYFNKKENRWIESDKLQYEITVNRTKYLKIKRQNRKIIPYEKYVYCCEVPNNSLYVRRNGKAIWCGNTIMEIAFAYEFRKPVLMITTEDLYMKHPFVSNMVDWYFDSVEDMLNKKAVNIYYKAWNSSQY